MADSTNAVAVAHSRGPRTEEIEGWLVARISELTRVDEYEIETSTPFFELGLESSSVVELASALAAWLERPIEPTVAWNFPTIRALAGHLAEQGGAPGQGPTARDPSSEAERLTSAALLQDLLRGLYES